MKKLYLIGVFAALLATTGTISAQVVNSFIRTGDAVSAGLSGASVTIDADAFALDNNPAAMSLYSNTMAAGVGFSIINPSSVKMQMISAAGFYKISSALAAGIDVKRLSYEPYATYAADGRSTGEFTPSEMAVTAGVSYLVMDGLSIGANVKFASFALAEGSSSSYFGIDASAMYVSGALRAGLDIRNIASPVMDIRGGASYDISSVTLMAQAEYLAEAGVMAAAGAQYNFKDMLFARAGFHYGNASAGIPSYGSVGLGAKFAGFSLDAAVLLGTASVSGTTVLSLGYAF